MNLPKLKSTKKERKQYIDKNPFEVIVEGVKETVVKDLGSGSINEAWDEILGADEAKAGEKKHGDLSEGAELDLADVSDKAIELTELGREFTSEIIHAGKRAQTENSQEIHVKIQEILIEIKKLSESSTELQKQVEVIVVEQTGEDTGVYHLNFMEQMLSYLHDLRLNVEDSLAWFSALRSKKAARQYGTMAKKHGTSFTLSNERQVSTQVG